MNIIDLGCGKGAVLIYLAKRLKFLGLGIDIMPDFIESANHYALEKFLNQKINFKVGNILDYINSEDKYDIVIYGYDSEILGNVFKTLQKLEKLLQNSGYLILEIAFTSDLRNRIAGLPSEKELLEQISKSNFKVLDKIFWDINKTKAVNKKNNIFISNRVHELMLKYPDKKKIFQRYMDNQIEECKLIENDMICSTWILRKV